MNNLFFNFLSKKSRGIVYLLRSVSPFVLVSLVLLTVLVGVTKGRFGNINDDSLNLKIWTDDGPLELSPDRGRFALTYSIAEDQSVKFSLPVARFATPDLGYKDGNFVSLFAPGVSFVVLPGYLIGRMFNASQIGTFLTISLFAFVNFWLIYAISRHLNAKRYASMFGAAIFSFATPALAYSGSLYQHHISTFLILFSVWLLLKFNKLWSLLIVWILVGASITIDNPNFFMMFPVGLVALLRSVNLDMVKNKISFQINLKKLLTIIAITIPISAFMYFNLISNGGPLLLSGAVEHVQSLDQNGKPVRSLSITDSNADVALLERIKEKEGDDSRSILGFFDSRNMLTGFYTQFFSLDRGMLFFTPIVFLGFLAIFVWHKKMTQTHILLFGVLMANLTIYALWGDPWGGWAFGSRYLIPAYAVLAIFSSHILSVWHRKIIFLLILYPVLIYSLSVNMVGALTSNRNPPQIEVLALEKLSGREEKYTFERNWDYLQDDSKSFVYKSFVWGRISSVEYFYILLGLSIFMASSILVLNYFDRKQNV